MARLPKWAKAVEGKTIKRVSTDSKDRAALSFEFTDGTNLDIIDLATPRLSIGYFFGPEDEDAMHGEVTANG
jgi:hypothetical protein